MTTCITCGGLIGCRILTDAKGMFVPERVITENNPGDCSSWTPTGTRQNDVRKMLYGLQGAHSLRVLHQLPAMVMDQLVEQERMDDMMNEAPDFAGLLFEGMTSDERAEQLRFETDDAGNFIEDEGSRRPRPSHQLRKFACDPSAHIQLDHSVGMFWTTDKIIQHIVAEEVEQGLITKSKRSRKPSQPSAKKGTTKTAAEAAPETETKMATGRRVMINRGGSAPAEDEEKKVAKPPAKRAAKAKPKANPEPAAEPGNGSASMEGFDIEALADDLKLAIGESIGGLISEKFNEIDARITALQNQISEMTMLTEKQKDGTEKVILENLNLGNLIECLTAIHDVTIQTKGTLEGAGEMFGHPHLVYGYITDSQKQG
jgi:hypothetical protein